MPFFCKKIAAFALCLCPCLAAFAQKQAADSSLFKLVNGISSATEKYAPEKLYVHTDRPSYNTGDTLWFKIYLFDAAFLDASRQSGIVYLEIAGQNTEMRKRIMVALKDGLGEGYFALDEEAFPAGAYTLSAYTNWMRNFNRVNLFQKQFVINRYSDNEWLISARFHPAPGNPNQVETNLAFERQDKRPLSFRDLQIALTDGNRTWHKNTFKTNVQGELDVNFSIPASADKRKWSLLIKDPVAGSSEQDRIVPLALHRVSKTDLQFMPEGGDLIAGVENRVAFKALGEDGLGQDVSGVIYDSRRRVVDSFRSSHLGMGDFDLIPGKNEKYTAAVRTSDKEEILFPLPAVKNSGYALRVVDPFDKDSVEVSIFSAPDGSTDGGAAYLVAQARGIGCFGAKIVLQDGKETFHISKSLFPTGITRFTIYNADMQPLNQRMVFIDRHDLLVLNISGTKDLDTRDKAEFTLKVSDEKGRPVTGSFSVAVTDDRKVYMDSLKRNSLTSYVLLTSGLKGYVEEPGYYFPGQMTGKISKDRDDLLLTQGWVAYSRDTMSAPQYPAEQYFSVEGKVTNIFNKPVAGSQVLLLSRKPFLLEQAATDAGGAFHFGPLYPVDTASFMLQARNKKGKSFNVGVVVDAFKPPVIAPLNLATIPWYVKVDSTRDDIVKAQVADQKILDQLWGKHVLKEVVVVGQRAIRGSKNLNGPGGSDFVLNQSDMEKAGKSTLGDVLRQKVKGFHLGGKHLDTYLINTEKVHFIIDGLNLDFFKPEGISDKEFYDQYMNYITAEDIKGIEVMTSPRYTGAYFQKFLDPRAEPFEHVFIEITTYSGNGAFLKKTPGVFLYRPPVAFSTPARFYSPQYTVKEEKSAPDLRSTIYWEPDIVTDAKGEARISFYTADKPGVYTLILEGADMNGNIGSTVKKIVIQK